MDFLESIRNDGDLFYETATGADPSRQVPSCPDWNVADLVWHLAEVHFFWASDAEVRPSDPSELESAKPARPEQYAELLSFGRSQLDRLIRVLEETPDDVPVWTWTLDEAGHNVGFIRRHQVQEAAVHRWDMQKAVGDGPPDPIGAEAAADSIDEFLWSTLPWDVNDEHPLDGSVHLHCTDVDGEWFLHPNGVVERTHAKADVALRGTASDLILALYNRVSISDLELFGDEAVLQDLLARMQGT